MRLPRPFYRRNARTVARDLLGRLLVTDVDGQVASGRIIETEAYLGLNDPASHSHRGQTPRNRSMFREGGHAYVYLIYGMHYCFNVVTAEAGVGEAVLVRAIEPVEGLDLMRRRRHPAADAAVGNGPAKLVVALGIGPELDGADLVMDERVWLEPGTGVPEREVLITPRIGITRAAELPYRFVVAISARARRDGPRGRGR